MLKAKMNSFPAKNWKGPCNITQAWKGMLTLFSVGVVGVEDNLFHRPLCFQMLSGYLDSSGPTSSCLLHPGACIFPCPHATAWPDKQTATAVMCWVPDRSSWNLRRGRERVKRKERAWGRLSPHQGNGKWYAQGFRTSWRLGTGGRLGKPF